MSTHIPDPLFPSLFLIYSNIFYSTPTPANNQTFSIKYSQYLEVLSLPMHYLYRKISTVLMIVYDKILGIVNISLLDSVCYQESDKFIHCLRIIRLWYWSKWLKQYLGSWLIISIFIIRRACVRHGWESLHSLEIPFLSVFIELPNIFYSFPEPNFPFLSWSMRFRYLWELHNNRRFMFFSHLSRSIMLWKSILRLHQNFLNPWESCPLVTNVYDFICAQETYDGVGDG